LADEIAARKVVVAEGERDAFVAVGGGLARRRAPYRRRWDVQCAVAGGGEIVAVAVQFEAIGDEIQPAAVADLIAEAAEQGPALGIHQFALREVEADAASLRVIKRAAGFVRGADG